MDEIRAAAADIPGILVEVTAPKGGPPTGKAIQVQLTAIESAVLPEAARRAAALIAARNDITDLDDGLPLPGLDWEIVVDKAEAAKYGIAASQVGTAVQLITNGTKITDFRPEGTDKAVDIIVRFPPHKRTLDELDELRITGPASPSATASRSSPATTSAHISSV